VIKKSLCVDHIKPYLMCTLCELMCEQVTLLKEKLTGKREKCIVAKFCYFVYQVTEENSSSLL